MPDAVRIDLVIPNEIVGSAAYTVAVTVTNTGSSEVRGVQVQPQVLPGRLLTRQVEVRDSEESQLESRRWALIEEMEAQVAKAYRRQRLRGAGPEVRVSLRVSFFDELRMLLSRPVDERPPEWVSEAFTINEWEDVEVLEREIIAHEPEGSNIRKAFMIDKGKLQRCLAALAEKTSQPVALDAGPGLAPGSSLTFPYVVKAPHLFRRREVDLQFRLTYRETDTNRLTSQAIGRRVTMYPSPVAVPFGGVVGGMCGHTIRLALQHSGAPTTFTFEPITFVGATLLGLVIALLTSRKPESYKVITAEDFVGGFLIGAIVGLFANEALERMRSLVVAAKTG